MAPPTSHPSGALPKGGFTGGFNPPDINSNPTPQRNIQPPRKINSLRNVPFCQQKVLFFKIIRLLRAMLKSYNVIEIFQFPWPGPLAENV